MYGCYNTWDFKVVHIKRYFALNVFVLTRFHCTYSMAYGSQNIRDLSEIYNCEWVF